MCRKLVNRIMTRKAVFIWAIVLFIITLYWVNYSPWSSQSLQQYNGGYGTFDMRSYNVDTVYHVLDVMETKGFTIYGLYFVGDFLFAICHVIVQLRLLKIVTWNFHKFTWIKFLFWIPIVKFTCDLVENTVLSIVLNNYPLEMPTLVTIAQVATYIKLKADLLWYIIMIVSIIINIITKVKLLHSNKTKS